MCQTIWSQIRPDEMSGLIWVQTVCKGCQQKTPAVKEFKLIYKKSKVSIVPLSNGQINCEIYLPRFFNECTGPDRGNNNTYIILEEITAYVYNTYNNI